LSLFDLIAGALIAVTALVGYQRGGVREIVGLFAFSLAVIVALQLLPYTTPAMVVFFHPRWVAVVAAIALGFAVAYVGVLLVSRWLSALLSRQPLLGGLNQVIGLVVGAVRAFVILGLFALVYDRAVPDRVKPHWVTGAFFYPLASASGRIIARLAPTDLGAFGRPNALLNGEDSPDTTRSDQTGAPATTPPTPQKRHRGAGYDRNSRNQIDDLVERTR